MLRIISHHRHVLGFCLLLLCTFVYAEVEIPNLSRRVTDLTGTLNPKQIAKLENTLAALEAQKGSQIAVLMLPTTQPEDIAQFGIRVADVWKIGREDVDDGVILIIAKNDRKLRIEVGYGLEGVISDAVAKRVIEETITPHFKQGDFAGGILAGVNQLIKLIAGEALPAPKPKTIGNFNESAFVITIFFGMAVGFVLAVVIGRQPAGLISGIGSGVFAVLLLGLSIGMAVFIAFVIFFIVGIGQQRHSRGYYGGYGGGYHRGGGGGGSWSGGGGGFGGGGSSGSW